MPMEGSFSPLAAMSEAIAMKKQDDLATLFYLDLEVNETW